MNDGKFFGNPGYEVVAVGVAAAESNNGGGGGDGGDAFDNIQIFSASVSSSSSVQNFQQKQKQEIGKSYDNTSEGEVPEAAATDEQFDDGAEEEGEREQYDTRIEFNSPASKARFANNFQQQQYQQQRQQYQSSLSSSSTATRRSVQNHRSPNVRVEIGNDAVGALGATEAEEKGKPSTPPSKKPKWCRWCRWCRCWSFQVIIIAILVLLVSGTIIWISIINARINDAIKTNQLEGGGGGNDGEEGVLLLEDDPTDPPYSPPNALEGGVAGAGEEMEGINVDGPSLPITTTYHGLQHFEFYTNEEVQSVQRYPERGGIPGMEDIEKIDFYQVCCIDAKQSLICARGITNAGPNSLDAVLRYSPENNECYLEVWVNGVDLTRVKCKLSYVLEGT